MDEEPIKDIYRSTMIRGKEIHYKAVVKVQEQAVAKVLMGGKLNLDSNMTFERRLERQPRLKVA